MFYFLNLGAFTCYASGALSIGGCGYVTWHFKDTIVTTITSSKINEHTSKPRTDILKNIDKNFQDELGRVKKLQENRSGTETELEKTKTETQIYKEIIETLKQEILNMEGVQKKYTSLIEKSRKKVLELTKEKTQQDDVVKKESEEESAQDNVVKQLQETLLSSINVAVEKAQQDLNEAQTIKNQKAQEFDKHQTSLEIQKNIIKQSKQTIDILTVQKDKKIRETGTQNDLQTTKLGQKQTLVAGVSDEITSYIAKLDSEIRTLNEGSQKLVTEIESAKKGSESCVKQLNEIDKNKTLNTETKSTRKLPLQTQKNKHDSDVAQKTKEKQAKESQSVSKTTEKNELTKLKTQSLPYETIPGSTIKTSLQNKSDQIKDLNVELEKLSHTIKTLTDEKTLIETQITSTQKTNTDATTQKDTLEAQETSIKQAKTTTEVDYEAKQNTLTQEKQKQNDAQNKLQEQQQALREKQIAYSCSQITQNKLQHTLQEEKDKEQKLNDQKSVIDEQLKNKKLKQTKHTEILDAKTLEIQQHEKTLNNN